MKNNFKVTIEYEDEKGCSRKTVLEYDRGNIEMKRGLDYGPDTPFGGTAVKSGGRRVAQINLWSGMPEFSMEQQVLDGRGNVGYSW